MYGSQHHLYLLIVTHWSWTTGQVEILGSSAREIRRIMWIVEELASSMMIIITITITRTEIHRTLSSLNEKSFLYQLSFPSLLYDRDTH
ncbi:unnamed protein product [Trichobilharzia regenti]|nr:unnamed protein product [Trichobilharzia regenti]